MVWLMEKAADIGSLDPPGQDFHPGFLGSLPVDQRLAPRAGACHVGAALQAGIADASQACVWISLGTHLHQHYAYVYIYLQMHIQIHIHIYMEDI